MQYGAVVRTGRLIWTVALLVACDGPVEASDAGTPDEVLAEGIFAPPGDPLPLASEEHGELFDRGAELAQRRWDLADAFGPSYSVASCVDCHGRPTAGGRSSRRGAIRLIRQRIGSDQLTVGLHGVQPLFTTGRDVLYPPVTSANVFALRHPTSLYGLGLLALVPDSEFSRLADDLDADGDGISGRISFDSSNPARFGVKASSSAIEFFVRGQIYEHLGISSLPLSPDERASLPLSPERLSAMSLPVDGDIGAARRAQGIDPNLVLTDGDEDAPDPEITSAELFALMAWVQLLAPPPQSILDETARRGEERFTELGCVGCHVPHLSTPLGLIPAYTDLLLHDMGPGLADGIRSAAGLDVEAEYRTAPLWAAGLGGPYLHDGRADTLDDAIRVHGGEAAPAASAYASLPEPARQEVLAFLRSFGGEYAAGAGTLPPDAPAPEAGVLGGPINGLDEAETARFLRGRALFDRFVNPSEGLGPRFDADSCSSCHGIPTLGGGGTRAAARVRIGAWTEEGFSEVSSDPWFALFATDPTYDGVPAPDVDVLERRDPLTLYVTRMIARVDVESMRSLADPNDMDGDGISGVLPELTDGALGRFGWQSTMASPYDAAARCLESAMGLTSGESTDADDIPDPELSTEALSDLVFYLESLAVPAVAGDPEGAALFESTGCASCHVPTLEATDGGTLDLFSDLLLHDVSAGGPGVAEGAASTGEYRTPSLRALSQTAPYMHTGRALSIEEAIAAHDGEARGSATAFASLSASDRQRLLVYLDAL